MDIASLSSAATTELARAPGRSGEMSRTPVQARMPAPDDPLRKVAEEFESVFLSTVISRMFSSLPTDGPFGGGHAEESYRSFLADEYAGQLAGKGGVGIADEVQAQLVRLQEASIS